jgi:hypothetical protein
VVITYFNIFLFISILLFIIKKKLFFQNFLTLLSLFLSFLFKPYIFKENQWRPDNKAFSKIDDSTHSSKFTLDNNELPKLVSSSILKKHFEYLYDFDEHLENIELDWLSNIKVVELAFEQNSKTK